jgi:hypothetical protein
MAVTLLDMAMLEKNPLRKGVLMTLLEEPFVIDRIPWENTGALAVTVTYVSGVPTVSFRNINEAPVNVEASTAQFQETLKVMEVNIDVDAVLLKPTNLIQNPRTLQTQVVVKGIAYTVNDLFINGDPTANVKNPTGLKYRSENDARFWGGATSGNDRGQVLDTAGALTNTEALKLAWLDAIDNAMYRVDAHKPSFCVMNKQTLMKLRSTLRAAKLLDTTQDQFDRRIDVYADCPLLDIGVKAAGAILGDEANQVIRNNAETSPFSSTASSTSLYFVRTGDAYVQGLQLGGLQTNDLGQLKDSPHLVRTNIQWILGFYVGQARSFSRLCGMLI